MSFIAQVSDMIEKKRLLDLTSKSRVVDTFALKGPSGDESSGLYGSLQHCRRQSQDFAVQPCYKPCLDV